MRGRIITEEARVKISKARKGTKASPALRAKLCASNATRRQVVCVETGVLYASTLAAAEAVNGDHSCISKCCIGIRKKHRGLSWRYAADGGSGNASDLNADNIA